MTCSQQQPRRRENKKVGKFKRPPSRRRATTTSATTTSTTTPTTTNSVCLSMRKTRAEMKKRRTSISQENPRQIPLPVKRQSPSLRVEGKLLRHHSRLAGLIFSINKLTNYLLTKRLLSFFWLLSFYFGPKSVKQTKHLKTDFRISIDYLPAHLAYLIQLSINSVRHFFDLRYVEDFCVQTFFSLFKSTKGNQKLKKSIETSRKGSAPRLLASIKGEINL